jgi:hypothetical protein
MRSKTPNQQRFTRPGRRRAWFLGVTAAACLAGLVLLVSAVLAAQPPVGLGTDGSFAVLAGQAVTNTGSSTVNGNLGVSPGSAVTGFPPGTLNGTLYAADATAAQAELDLTTAYNDAAGRTPATSVPADLGGLTLTAGVYQNASALGLTGALTLNAQGNPNAVFIFQAGSTLTTASGSSVNLINGAQPCNVYWQVGSSATLGTTTAFAGNILALTSISLDNGVTVDGRALARNGSVTLIDDTITAANCSTSTTGTTSGGTGSSGTSGTSGSGTGTGSGGGSTSGTAGHSGTARLTTLPGSVAHLGVSDCVSNAFSATVKGKRIRRVVFSLGGDTVATRKSAPFTASVSPGSGTHTLTAHVTFTDSTPAKTLHIAIKACAASVSPVKGSGGFTG